MIERLKQVILNNRLINPGAQVLTGVSGGLDSMFLLHALAVLRQELGFSLRVAQFDHQLRPESGEEQRFVARICDELGVPCVMGSADVAALAREMGLSLEAAAREARYSFFKEQLQPGELLALAHHMDDQAETVLLRLMRGAGTMGLGAMSMRSGNIIRPLLGFRKTELEQYCRENHFQWKEDASNTDLEFARNRVRNELLPYMEAHFNPGIVRTLARTALLMEEDECYLQTRIQPYVSQIRLENGEALLEIRILSDLDIALQKRLIRVLAAKAGMVKDLEAIHVEAVLDLLEGETGRSADIGWGFIATRDARDLCIYRQKEEEDFCMPLIVPGVTHTPVGDFICRICPLERPLKEYRGNTRVMDPDALKGVCVRTRRSGDVIHPLGSGGSKKLKEYLIDIKLPRRRRGTIPLICKENRVLWVAGYALDKSAAVDENNIAVAEITFLPQSLTQED